jgi:hypothetical protein
VLERKRRLGQQVLEIVIAGIKDERAARAAFESRIASLLLPDSVLPAENIHEASAAKATTAR